MFRQTDLPESEKVLPNFSSLAQNVSFDLHGSAYVSTGYRKLCDVPGTGNLRDLYYSPVLDKLVCKDDDGDINIINPVTGAITNVPTVMVGFDPISYADWPLTDRLYMSDGTQYKYINLASTVTDRSVAAPLGRGRVIFAHKNHMFSAGPPGRQRVEICPSSVNDPEAFATADIFSCDNGGPEVTAMSSLNGILHAHLRGNIYAIVGDAFAGSAKNIGKEPLNTSRGARKVTGVLTDDNITYIVAYDGIYRFNGAVLDKISGSIDGILMDIWTPAESAGDSHDRLALFQPLWGPDYGRRYLNVILSTVDGTDLNLRIDLITGDWTKLVLSDPMNFGITHSIKHAKTFFSSGLSIYYFDNVGTFDGDTIPAILQTNVIDAGSRVRDKQWQGVYFFPGDTEDLTLRCGMDGLPPTIPLTITGNHSMQHLADEFTSHLLSFEFRKSGGGRQITSGISLIFDPIELREGRDWSGSRKYSGVYQQANYPLFVKGTYTLAGGEASITIPITTYGDIVAAYACREGWTQAAHLLVTSVSQTAIEVTFPAGSGHGAGDKVHYFAVVDMRRFFDSYIRGKTFYMSSLDYVNHNLSVTPEAVLIGKRVSDGFGITISELDQRRAKFTFESGHATSPPVPYYPIFFKQGTVDTFFKCGVANASPIAHGLGATPSAVLIYPNSSPVPVFGIDSITSSQINYTGGGSMYWVAIR